MDSATRPSWDSYFMQIARDVSTRATCPRRHVGAVVVSDKRILSTGYNGAPHGLQHCTEVGCKMVDGHCIRTLHAEQNAIVHGALYGVSLRGSSLYVTCQPCNNCAKMIINAGIVKVVFDGDYPDPFAMELFEQAGTELIRMRSEEAAGETLLLPSTKLDAPVPPELGVRGRL